MAGEIFSFRNQENLGNQVEPLVLARFKASAELQEDTFYSVSNLENIPLKKQEGISFLKKAESRGQKVDIYGVTKSKRTADTWSNEFKFDTNPTVNTSQSRSQFSGKVILLDSQEESDFRAEVDKQIKAEKEVPFEKQADKVFLALSKQKGEKVDIQGLSIARPVEKNWQVDFSFSKNPTADFGTPINSFSGNLMIRDSKEEKDFIDGIKQEVKQKEEKINRVKSAIKSGLWLTGKWKQETVTIPYSNEEKKDNTFGTRNFQIRFKSFDENTAKLNGEIKFPSSLKEFEGEFKGEQISFEDKSVISGRDGFGLGMKFNFSFEEPNTMSGQWEYVGSVTLPDGAITNTVKVTGSASFKLK